MLDKSEYLHPDKECLSRSEIEALQLERLKQTVKHCYTNDIYKKKFAEAGITPDDIQTLEVFGAGLDHRHVLALKLIHLARRVRACKKSELPDGKIPLRKDLHHFLTDCAGRAEYTYIELFHNIYLTLQSCDILHGRHFQSRHCLHQLLYSAHQDPERSF